ncbi:hypothetical protein Pelo_3763 [Pelomyxa schiedti]|nr:hypothetical protein Pelo_3763 [Pelomyxa schiedti]
MTGCHKTFVVAVLVAVLVGSCWSLDPVCDTTREWRDDLTSKVLSTLVDKYGYSVADQGMYYYNKVTSFGASGEQAYGLYNLSRSIMLWDEYPIWRQLGNEAIIFVGCTPPPARYFGWRSYLLSDPLIRSPFTRGVDPVPWTALGDVLNQFVMETTQGTNSFSSTMAVVTVADGTTESVIKQAFLDNGFPYVNSDNMPGQYIEFGLESPSDTFLMENRVSCFIDSDQGAYYLNTTAPIYLVRPPSTQGLNLYPLLEYRSTETGMDESYLESSLDQLASQVEQYWNNKRYRLVSTTLMEWKPENWTDCLINHEFCGGISTDATYGHLPRPLIENYFDSSSDRFYVFVGISHYNAGRRAQYTSLELYNAMYVQVAGASDVAYNLSARAYEPPDVSYADQMFAVRFARRCDDDAATFCVEVREDALPDGDKFMAWSRAYLSPYSYTQPDPDEILFPRMLHFTKILG